MILKKIFIDTLGLFIVICFMAMTFKQFFGINNPYLQTYITDYGKTIYYYDYGAYFININQSFSKFGPQLELQWPTRTWQGMNLTNWPSALGNNLCVIFNWLYMPINIALWPLRLLSYIIKEVLILLGFVEQPLTINGNTYQPQWFMQTLTYMTEHLFIPYL